MEETQLDAQLCQQCRGRCCQGHPGVWSDPQRFFTIFLQSQPPTAETLSDLFTKNDIELRDLGGILIPSPRSTDQGCSAQNNEGCNYPTAERPCQCLALVPNLETLLDDQIHCSMPPTHGAGTARNNWRPLQNLLKKTQIKKEKHN